MGGARRTGKRLSQRLPPVLGPDFSARGRTQRTEVMFGPPGAFYVYLVYGLHWMLNVVTGAPGHAAAVLIRSADPFRGPGRLARGLQISRALNGVQAQPSAGLWFEDAHIATSFRIHAGPRIGVGYAGPVWSRRKLRFVLEGAQRPRNR